MLGEAKITCRALDKHYEPELCRLIKAGIQVLKTRGIVFDGDFTYTTETEAATGLPVVATHECTIMDAWVKTVVLTYVKAYFPGIKDAEKLQEAFENMLGSMMNTDGYTDWKDGSTDGESGGDSAD